MFTGLIEDIGTVKSAKQQRGSVVFRINAKRVAKSLRINDSIAVDGVCLTVVKRSGPVFETQAVEETLSKTTLARLREGSKVNLERPMLSTSRLGGHFVLGHVDCIGTVASVERKDSSDVFWISVPENFSKYLIPVGSVAVNGVSLTVANLKDTTFAVSIIPHTTKKTTFKSLQKGDSVNIEFDVLGKYVESLLLIGKSK
ncbi:MAG: riboflavin synthase [Ignavibacteriae bacterium]|nr:riboflavin synthase [Ignavibacteriota bacterium]